MYDLSGQILILTGPPGSGKTTTARSLAAGSTVPAVHLHTDDFWRFIARGAIPPYLPEAQAQNGVVMNVIARAAEEFAKGGYFVIVDGIIGPWFLGPFMALAVPVHYIVLRPPLAIAVERCRRRGGDTLSDADTIAALYEQLSSLGDLERHVMPTESDATPQDTLEAVIAAVSRGRFRL